jgi:hypothetical protein
MSEERTKEPSEVLQAALLDLVHGARAVLDVVEELVTDPSGVARVVETTFGAMRHAADAATGARSAAPDAAEKGESAASPASRVTRIRVQ